MLGHLSTCRLTSKAAAAAALRVMSVRAFLLTRASAPWPPCRRVITNAGRKLSSDSRPVESGANGEETLCEMAEALADTPELAKVLVARMDATALREVTRAWATLQAEPAPPPQAWQLRRLALLAGLPMVGFGFMDNFIMLLAGDFIDATLCRTFCLSTMFAAGIGNIISDVVGLAAAGPIELSLKRIGIGGHNLSPSHQQLWSVVTCKYAGSAVGMVLGCLVGMCPLLFPEKYRLWESRAMVERSAGGAAAAG